MITDNIYTTTETIIYRGCIVMVGKDKSDNNSFFLKSITETNKHIFLVQKVLAQTKDALKLLVKKIQTHDKIIDNIKSDINQLSKKTPPKSDPAYDAHIRKLVDINRELVKVINNEKHFDNNMIPKLEKKVGDLTREIRMNYSNIKDIQLSAKHMDMKQKSLEKSIISIHPATNDSVKYHDIITLKQKITNLANLNKRIITLVHSSPAPKHSASLEKEISLIKQTVEGHSKKIFQIERFDDDELRVLVDDLEKAMRSNKERVDRIETSSNNVERELSSILKMNSKFVSLLNRKEQMEYQHLKISAQEAKRLSEVAGNLTKRVDVIENRVNTIGSSKPSIIKEHYIPSDITAKIDDIKSHISHLRKLQSPDITPQITSITERLDSLESKINSKLSSPPNLDIDIAEIMRIKEEMHSMMGKTRNFVSLVSRREALSMKGDEALKSKETQLDGLVDSLTKLIEQTERKRDKLDMMIAQGQQVFTLLKKKERRADSELDVQLDAILSKI